jgi:hypothetical protein
MADTFTDQDWEVLVQRIKDQKVTPFLGAGACYGLLPLGADIAGEWSEKEGYPLADKNDLIRVAQYLAVKYDPTYPKELIQRKFAAAAGPDPRDREEPHRILAGLPFPVFLTTNYDDFLVRSLKAVQKDPRRDFCRWSPLLRDREDLPTIFESEPKYEPTVANPLVFHLHGHLGPNHAESLVLTEDDYLEFLAAISRDQKKLLPARVETALNISTCVFIGYRLADWNFRVLFQGLRPTITKQRKRSIAVMPAPGENDANRELAVKYLGKYFESFNLRVYWGTAREFCAELQRRWSSGAA